MNCRPQDTTDLRKIIRMQAAIPGLLCTRPVQAAGGASDYKAQGLTVEEGARRLLRLFLTASFTPSPDKKGTNKKKQVLLYKIIKEPQISQMSCSAYLLMAHCLIGTLTYLSRSMRPESLKLTHVPAQSQISQSQNTLR
jgi:hypothetical protein